MHSHAFTFISPSGDTDIFLLFVCVLSDFKEIVELDNGSGASRK